MSHARKHHYVPACYLKHFATPQERREGKLYVYDRYNGRTFKSSPHNSAQQKDFYSVEIQGESPTIVEDSYAKLEARFAPTLASVVKREVLPTNPTEVRELLAFVASQAVRTPRVRQMMQQAYGKMQMGVLKMLASNKPAFMRQLREMEGEVSKISDDKAEALFTVLGERVSTEGAHVEFGQTKLIGDALDLSAGLEDELIGRHWILGVAPNDARFITSDDPVHLQWEPPTPPPPRWSPGFSDPNTKVMVPLSPRLMLIGLSYPIDRARVRFQRKNVAGINADLALAAQQFIYSSTPTFAQMTDGGAVEGPTEALRITSGAR